MSLTFLFYSYPNFLFIYIWETTLIYPRVHINNRENYVVIFFFNYIGL